MEHSLTELAPLLPGSLRRTCGDARPARAWVRERDRGRVRINQWEFGEDILRPRGQGDLNGLGVKHKGRFQLWDFALDENGEGTEDGQCRGPRPLCKEWGWARAFGRPRLGQAGQGSDPGGVHGPNVRCAIRWNRSWLLRGSIAAWRQGLEPSRSNE